MQLRIAVHSAHLLHRSMYTLGADVSRANVMLVAPSGKVVLRWHAVGGERFNKVALL
jgi:hypothetical protein